MRIWNPVDCQGQRSRSPGQIFMREDTPRFALPLFDFIILMLILLLNTMYVMHVQRDTYLKVCHVPDNTMRSVVHGTMLIYEEFISNVLGTYFFSVYPECAFVYLYL